MSEGFIDTAQAVQRGSMEELEQLAQRIQADNRHLTSQQAIARALDERPDLYGQYRVGQMVLGMAGQPPAGGPRDGR